MQLDGLKALKRKLEKELEEELGDDYTLDLKKNYDLRDEYKYDIIPEFWDGHNIADFIDPDIFRVCLLLLYHFCDISRYTELIIFSYRNWKN